MLQQGFWVRVPPSVLPAKVAVGEQLFEVVELSSPIELGELITEIDNGWTASVLRAQGQKFSEPRFIADAQLIADASLAAAEGEDGDPLETVNRFMFGFNEYLQDYAMRPIAHAYNDYFPSMKRRSKSSWRGIHSSTTS